MGLFSNKKERPEMPKPEMYSFDAPKIPNLERLQFPEPNFPESKMSMPRKMVLPDELSSIKRSVAISPAPPSIASSSDERYVSKKGLFIKIEKYKEALESIEQIKTRINEIENALMNLEKMRRQEDLEIEKWRRDLNSIKQKLLGIDNTLFRE
ncbi:hypothetical protein HY500_02510 [Candidatus Woesearchaeota archaeon]|nr:hypothetical protein [Candidatus Woesearchaeota archaeon]